VRFDRGNGTCRPAVLLTQLANGLVEQLQYWLWPLANFSPGVLTDNTCCIAVELVAEGL